MLEGISFQSQAVEKRTPDFFEQSGGMWHKIGDTIVEWPHMKIGIVADVDQFVGARGGGVAVFAGGDADLSRGGEVLWIEVGKGFGISVDVRNHVDAFWATGGD